ncbi:hypothetical protein, conserved [Leishmania tarentolae]|uniref:Conserved oligomeric Golgi complex subunit 1 n=1 Tax=Leishmania tarentolae TaxID=5689 RepID=A0A640K7D0_LEITA|nr:hypothetical protein, conserved [Leishmania tarentolae]
MAMEEAAQEVRRILSQNDVGETLHYLSTVTRCIEDNQHNLRAVIGNSYRDLLGACDGVVGMERDCADILTMEQALERVSATRAANSHGNAEMDTEPLLPPSWFSACRRRQTRAASAALTTAADISNTASSDQPSRPSGATRYAATNSERRSEGSLGASATTTAAAVLSKDHDTHGKRKAEVNAARALPVVELPLPRAAPTHRSTQTSHHNAAAVNGETDAGTLAAQRMHLDDELQALHLDCMTLASATASMSRGATAVDAKLGSLLPDSSAFSSLPLPARQHDEQQDRHRPDCSHHLASAAGALGAASEASRDDLLRALERDLPLVRLAHRLHRVQAALHVYAEGNGGAHASLAVADAAIQSSAALAGASVGDGMRSAPRPPSWVSRLQRRATALEARLTKLMLQLLRRAADDHAWLAEQVPKATSGADPTDPLPKAMAARAAEQRYLANVWRLLAQCHVALWALRASPTLVNALVACAPGVALPERGVPPPGIPGTESAAATPPIASLDSAVDALLRLATQDVRSVVSSVMNGAASFSSAPAGDATADEVVSGVADPCRMLLAVLAVLLLRESQLSAARWMAVAPSLVPATHPSAGAPSQTAACASPQPSSVQSKSFVGNQVTDAAVDCSTWDRAKAEGGASPLLHTATSPESHVFATAAHLSALGLATAAHDHPRAPTAPPSTRGRSASNTTWALRCFSGLAYLLRAFADYVDLVQAASAEVASASTAPDEETAALYLLQHISSTGGVASEVQLGATDHSAYVAALALHEDEQSSFSTPAIASGVRSLEELLQWRLRKVCGSVAASGVPEEAPGMPFGSMTAKDTSALPPHIGINATPMTPMRDHNSVASTKVAAGVVAASPSGAMARRRAYVAFLRANLSTVDELQASSVPATVVGERSLSDREHVAVTGDARATTRATDVVAPLRLVCQQLLTPLVSSLVLLLARDPVALVLHSEHQRGLDARPAMQAARDALEGQLRNCTQPSSVSGAQGTQVRSGVSGVGHTWTAANEARWWELVEQTTMRAALQRCVAVALESVSFVEACVSQGLAASAYHMLQSSVEASHTELEPSARGVGDGDTCCGPTGASSLEQTWSALFSVLRLHALSTMDSVSDAGGEGSLEGAERTSGMTTEPVGGPTGRCGKGISPSSAMAGICWARFQQEAAKGDVGNTRTLLSTLSGEGIFCEDGLEWGRAAYQAARLPPPALPDATDAKGMAKQQQQTPDAAAVNAELSASQQVQLANILSGMRGMLFPDWARGGTAEPDVTQNAQLGARTMNGHAAELLHRCLLTLVEAVQVQTSTVQASASNNSAESPPSTPPLQLHMYVVGWLQDALHRSGLQLRNAKTGAPPDRANATVVHSYELSLIVRVYMEVLQRLQMAAPPSEVTRVRQLCTEAEDLYERAQAPWQEMLTQFYGAALHQAYRSVLRWRESGAEEPRHSETAGLSCAALSRRSHLRDSAAWVRAPMAGCNPSDDRNADSDHGVAYPAQPTPAVMTHTQAALRYFHQALYGAPSVFSDSQVPFMQRSSGTGGMYGVASVSEQGGSGAASAAASAGRTYGSGCRLQVLVTGKMQQRVLERLAATSAELYESDLCPLVDVVDGGGDRGAAAPVGGPRTEKAAPATAAAAQSEADDLRLQWYMDALFLSSVWCAGSGSGGSGRLPIPERDSPAKALFMSDTGSSGVGIDAAACVAEGPLRRVVRHLEGMCDRVRWRSGVPLVLAAYRQFIVASALLWVAHSEDPHNNGDAGDARDGGTPRASSVAAEAATRPCIAAGSVTAAPFSTESLLLPRERVNRLPLLPIATSSSAALAGASTGAGGKLSAAAASAAALSAQSYSLPLPTALGLNPYPPSSSSSVSVPRTGLYGFGAPSSSVTAAAAGASGGVGAADMTRVAEVAVPAGSSSAAAAAASSVWGTTQRGWSQLWGTG